MPAYYNEIDPKAAAWLRELVARGLIAPGEVDCRSIAEVRPDEIRGFTQCHFFAGIGVWSYALRAAGWPDDRPVWTGSCPCQPFSDAGAKAGFDDERHLWPTWFNLIRECRPGAVFGEQVASKDGLAWLDIVHADLEGEAYTVGAVDTCAAGFGSPNIRQRLYFVAHSEDAERRAGERREEAGAWPDGERRRGSSSGGAAGLVEHTEGQRWLRGANDADGGGRECPPRHRREARGLADADGGQSGDGGLQRGGEHRQRPEDGRPGGMGDASSRGRGIVGDAALPRRGGHADGADQAHRPGPVNGHWRDADWLFCTDGKWRPVEPGTFPLVTGAPARLVRLRGYGNGLNAEAAREFIEAYLTL